MEGKRRKGSGQAAAAKFDIEKETVDAAAAVAVAQLLRFPPETFLRSIVIFGVQW